MRDVNLGWLIRYIHANGASFFFGCMYIHIGKALYYGSYRKPRVLVWIIGVIILIATMATGFMGKSSSPKLLYSSGIKNKKINNVFSSYNPSGCGGQISKRNFSTSFYHYNSEGKKNNIILEVNQVKNEKLVSAPVLSGGIIESKIQDIFNEIGIKPLIWWDNLEQNSVVNNIREELKNKSGIYIIINKINRKYYVGSAYTNYLYIRFRQHLISSGNKGSILIKPDLKLYGREGFIYGILEFYPYPVNMSNNKELYALETSYISLLLPSYNIMLEAGQFFGFKTKDININNDKDLINLSILNERKELLQNLREKHLEKYKLTRKVRTDFTLSTEGLNNIKKGSNKRIFLSKNMLSNEDIINNKGYLCWFKNVDTSAHYLCCSRKMIQRALNNGFIYIPNVFLPLLNNNHVHNNNSIIEFINKSELKDYHYTGRKNKSLKIKATLDDFNDKVFTKIFIKGFLERELDY